MSLGIIALLTCVGEDIVRVQNLMHGDVNVTATKHGARVTFYTDPAHLQPGDLLTGNGRYVGLVVWLPRADVDRVMAEHAAPVMTKGDGCDPR